LFQPHLEKADKNEEMRVRIAVTVTPLPRGEGVKTATEPSVLPEGAHLTTAHREALEQGVRFSLGGGPIEGAPLEDMEVRVDEVELFGSASTADALSAAASRAVHRAITNASPTLLQPIMATEVVVPEENLGAVLGDLQSRHAVIRDTSRSINSATIACEVALSQLLGYTTELRSMTQGRGQFSTLFERFDKL